MTDDGGYELKPADPPPTSPPDRVPDAATVPGASAGDTPAAPKLKPGDPGWTPPVPVIEQADADEPPEPAADPDIQQHKGLAILGYICFVIPLVASHMGLSTRGGAEGVGRSTTTAVVLMTLSVLIVDALFPPLLLN